MLKRFFVSKLKREMEEPRQLPMGMTEANEWADRIVKAAMIPAEPGKEQDLYDSMKFTAFSMILQLSPTDCFKPDGYFIKGLRKAAANQIAVANQQALQQKIKARIKREEELKTVGSGGVVTLIKDAKEEKTS